MAETVKLEVITPSKMFYRGEVELVVVTTPDGEEGFMANHSWAVKLVDIGYIRIKEPGESTTKEAFVSGGYIDVKESILLYVDAAEWVEDIDYEKAEKQKADSEAFLESVKRGEYNREEWLETGVPVVPVSLPEYGDDIPPALALEVQRVERKHRRAVMRIRLAQKHERQSGKH